MKKDHLDMASELGQSMMIKDKSREVVISLFRRSSWIGVWISRPDKPTKVRIDCNLDSGELETHTFPEEVSEG